MVTPQADTQADTLVTVGELSAQTGIPVYAIYRLIRRKKIPYVDVTQIWNENRQYRFDPDQVMAALKGRQRRAS